MSVSFIEDEGFRAFVSGLINDKTVIGPVAKSSRKQTRFVFARLESPDELRLDYDVTILPPKKEFFPPRQDLIRFEGTKYQPCIEPEEKILLGVHAYDVKALDITDTLFREKNPDYNYLAHREAATIIASNVQAISPRAFWGSIRADVPPRGHDAFLTRIPGGYVLETCTPKGEDLLAFGRFAPASQAQVAMARKVNDEALAQCQQKLEHSSTEIAHKVRAAFGNTHLWEELARDCFSCGSCNTVCPTCYCFDVQDSWNLDQTSGCRTRYWDACLTEDFAKISLGAGASENPRDERAERFRHRIMRKAAYLNEKLGGPACVGCGRCSSACTADIADPVAVIGRIMEA